MDHLDILELDSIRAGDRPEPEHLGGCAECRAALEKIRGLGARLAPRFDIPADIDRAVMAAARRPRVMRIRDWAAVAAAAALLVGLALMHVAPPAPGDLDRDGRVDIVDAYRLAVELQRGEARLDVNGDGRVDQVDVDVIGFEATRLSPRRGS